VSKPAAHFISKEISNKPNMDTREIYDIIEIVKSLFLKVD